MVRVLEFFSGIGGMRISLAGALAPLGSGSTGSSQIEASGEAVSSETGGSAQTSVGADIALHFNSFDTSESVNQVYRFNFPGERLRQVNIESMKAPELDAFGAEVWTMSPPCQPFTTTQNSKRLDVSDMRNKAFMHLMKCLDSMTKRPEWIFFENVKGFEGSESHVLWTECLTRCGYEWQQYLLSPLQFRVPNGRTRFYMAIHRIPASGNRLDGFSQDISIVLSSLNRCACADIWRTTVRGESLDCSPLYIGADVAKAHEVIIDDVTGPEGINPISRYIDSDAEASREYVLDDLILRKNWAAGLSIVGREDRCTFCFTSSYGKTFHRSSGSILHMEESRGRRVLRTADMSESHSNKMRLFTPHELLRIFGFPDNFTYPPGMSTKHMYKCIGQSINVVVVRCLMHAVLCNAKRQGCLTFTCASAQPIAHISSSSSSSSSSSDGGIEETTGIASSGSVVVEEDKQAVKKAKLGDV